MDLEIIFSVTLLLFIALLIPSLFNLAKFVGPRNYESRVKNEVYESGISKMIGSSTQKYNIKYYLIAILFVLFDVEIIFMYPWAVSIHELGVIGVIEMFSFITILILGLIYIINKKVFN